jgi:2-dehydropantoate 2-reductase
MRVAVMAAGAVGGYFGARIAAAGHDVAFIARGAHRDAIRRDGLKIESALGDLHLNDVNVTNDPKQVGPVDVVLFAAKLWDTETAKPGAASHQPSFTSFFLLLRCEISLSRQTCHRDGAI